MQAAPIRRRLALFAIAASFSLGSQAAERELVGNTILLGQSAPFSGPSSQLATEFNLGARTYFQSVNEAGGVHGRKIELRTRDDAYDPARTVQNTHELIEKDGVLALFGYIGTSTTLAALPVLTAAQVPLFAPASGAAALREPFNRYVFNLRAGYAEEADHIVEQLSITNLTHLAVFHQSDAFGSAGMDAVAQAGKKRKLSLGTAATIERDSTDVAAPAKALLAAHPDAVVLVSSYASCAALIKEMRKGGFKGQFVSLSHVGGKSLADELGSAGAGLQVSEVVPFPWAEASPIQREYAQAMRKAGVPTRSFHSMEGFIAAKAMTEALRRTGPTLTRARLISALETMHDWDAGGYHLTFSPETHNGGHMVEMTMLGSDGRFLH
jgi:ABC-type branched-subunit amino acid transport system substrate-binding protein